MAGEEAREERLESALGSGASSGRLQRPLMCSNSCTYGGTQVSGVGGEGTQACRGTQALGRDPGVWELHPPKHSLIQGAKHPEGTQVAGGGT